MTDGTPKRIRLSRAKGWRMPEGAIKVDRSTPFGNPWKCGAPGVVRVPFFDTGGALHELDIELASGISDATAVAAFRFWLGQNILTALPGLVVDRDGTATPPVAAGFTHMRQRILDRLPDIRGHDLACWCALDAACHADVLLELANG